MDPNDCSSCFESPQERCPKSRRPCGHHCNHSWSHDICCWCDTEWGEATEMNPDGVVNVEVKSV